MSRRPTPIVAKVLYWFLGAPVAFLAVMYTGTTPLLLLGPAEERTSVLNLAVASYAAVLLVAALFFTWSCWRAVRGDPPAIAFRLLPWWAWAGAAVLGLSGGAIELMMAG